MAIYHLSMKMIGRSSGRTAVGSASYRAGEKIYSEYDGVHHDYRRKKGVIHKEIMLPEEAPQGYQDRAVLWNVVEQAEKRKDSQTAREIEVALPRELDQTIWQELVREYTWSEFVSVGMCADITIHDEGRGNPHAHIMLTTRSVSNTGFGKKNTAWNHRDNAEIWRASWAQICNHTLERHGRDERIDHRSYLRQGKEELPTIHLGSSTHEMEERGVHTQRGDRNREIAAYNANLHEALRQKEIIQSLEGEAWDILDEDINECCKLTGTVYSNWRTALPYVQMKEHLHILGKDPEVMEALRDRKSLEKLGGLIQAYERNLAIAAELTPLGNDNYEERLKHELRELLQVAVEAYEQAREELGDEERRLQEAYYDHVVQAMIGTEEAEYTELDRRYEEIARQDAYMAGASLAETGAMDASGLLEHLIVVVSALVLVVEAIVKVWQHLRDLAATITEAYRLQREQEEARKAEEANAAPAQPAVTTVESVLAPQQSRRHQLLDEVHSAQEMAGAIIKAELAREDATEQRVAAQRSIPAIRLETMASQLPGMKAILEQLEKEDRLQLPLWRQLDLAWARRDELSSERERMEKERNILNRYWKSKEIASKERDIEKQEQEIQRIEGTIRGSMGRIWDIPPGSSLKDEYGDFATAQVVIDHNPCARLIALSKDAIKAQEEIEREFQRTAQERQRRRQQEEQIKARVPQLLKAEDETVVEAAKLLDKLHREPVEFQEEVQRLTFPYDILERQEHQGIDVPHMSRREHRGSNQVEKYLVEFGIDTDIVKELVRTEHIVQGGRDACYFAGYDYKGVVRSVYVFELLAFHDRSEDKSFGESYIRGSRINTFTMEGRSERLYLFANPIEALLHATQTKDKGEDWKQDSRLSLNGISSMPLERCLNLRPDISEVVLCISDDEANREIAETMLAQIAELYPQLTVWVERMERSQQKEISRERQRGPSLGV